MTDTTKPTPPTDGRQDFDFIHGRWRVQNERLRERLVGSTDWDVFDATDEFRPVLDGAGNLEEFHTAWNGGFEGIALRLYDVDSGEWRIHWASNRSGALDPPVSGRFEDGVGTFYGSDQHAGRPVRVRFLWSRTSANCAHWQQAFSADGGSSWETNWHMWFRRVDEHGRLRHDDVVLELRQYTLQPGQRDVLIDLFEREFIETQEAVGMHVIGHFRDLDAPDRYVWLRGFPSMEARREALQGFYFGPVWQRHRDAANATMVDSDNVLLLRPAHPASGLAPASMPRPAIGTALPAGAVCIGTCALRAPSSSWRRCCASTARTSSPGTKPMVARTPSRACRCARANACSCGSRASPTWRRWMRTWPRCRAARGGRRRWRRRCGKNSCRRRNCCAWHRLRARNCADGLALF